MRMLYEVVRPFSNPKADRRRHGFQRLAEIPVGMQFIGWTDQHGNVIEVAEVSRMADTTKDLAFISQLVASSVQVQE